VRAIRSPAAICVASAAGSVVIAGSTTSTGRLVAGLAVKAFGAWFCSHSPTALWGLGFGV